MISLSTHKKILLALFIVLLFALAAFIYVKYQKQFGVIRPGELSQEKKEQLVAELNSRPVLQFLTENEKAALIKAFTKK